MSKQIVLKSLIQTPPKGRFAVAFTAYLDEVEKRTNGRIKFERYYSSALAKPPQILEATGAGIADLSLFIASYTPGRVPLATVGNIPGAYKHSWVATKALLEMYKTIPEMNAEMTKNNVRFVAPYGTGPFYCLNNKNIQSIEDLKGLKIAADGPRGLLVKELGASPVGMPITEIFTALNRGTVDGTIFGPSAITAFGMHEAAKSLWKVNFGGGVGPIAINLDKWNSLPADLQKIMVEVGEDHPKAVEQIYQIDGDNKSLQTIKKAGIRVTEATPEAQAEVDRVTNGVWKKWAKDLDVKGLPGSLVLEAYLANIKKYEPLCPFK
jgi:TRAP-type C4-dicarboxylate transport system substrate-binding protein